MPPQRPGPEAHGWNGHWPVLIGTPDGVTVGDDGFTDGLIVGEVGRRLGLVDWGFRDGSNVGTKVGLKVG